MTAEPKWTWVDAACGCSWREAEPAGFTRTSPRVCIAHKPDHPAAVGTSPQGFALVHVTYRDARPE